MFHADSLKHSSAFDLGGLIAAGDGFEANEPILRIPASLCIFLSMAREEPYIKSLLQTQVCEDIDSQPYCE